VTYVEYRQALEDMGLTRDDQGKGIWRGSVGEPPVLLTVLVSRKDTTVLVQPTPDESPVYNRFRRRYGHAAAFVRTYLEEDHE
jgi:hypothetical protein